jgi:DNA-directed RNA polymerase sigma subunit (sigma70/sigma32)
MNHNLNLASYSEDRLEAIMESLTEIESLVIRLRFGLLGYERHTLEETADMVTLVTKSNNATKSVPTKREGIRSMEVRVLQKLSALGVLDND